MAIRKNPSQRFRDWLCDMIADKPASTPLPPDTVLARKWSVSMSTIQRIIRPFRDRGDLVRIAGKGTFIREAPPGDIDSFETPGSSAERLADAIAERISEGALEKGEVLPAVKTICLRYRVNPSTVITAFRLLMKRGLAHKVGRYYWAGAFDTTSPRIGLKEAYFFCPDGQDFSGYFKGNYTNDRLQIAFRRMEHELLKHAFTIRYAPLRSFADLVKEWNNRRTYPFGLLFSTIDQPLYETFEPLLAKLQHQAGANRPRVLLICGSRLNGPFPPSVSVFSSPGNTFTTFCRTLARFLVKKGFHSVTLFYDQHIDAFRSLHSHVKIRTEIKHLSPDIDWRLIVCPKNADDTAERIFNRYLKDSGYLLSKYDKTSADVIRQELSVFAELEQCLSAALESDIWLFADDHSAAKALKWAGDHRIAVPEKISIMGLENLPEYYHLGISSCTEDWETIGYLLAHTLINDFKTARTTSGFIKPAAMVLERLTTR